MGDVNAMIYNEKQTTFPPLFAAVGCICHFKGKILLLKRIENKSYPGLWGIPTGKVEKNEDEIRAMVRELYEETKILMSSDNLDLINTYHIINNEMSFIYTVYLCKLEIIPNIETNPKEHTRFSWFSYDDTLKLDLVPDLDLCLKGALPYFSQPPRQLNLFTKHFDYETSSATSIEMPIKSLMKESLTLDMHDTDKDWYVAFGPPSAGKTTALKFMAENHDKYQLFMDNTIMKRGTTMNFYLRKVFLEDDHSFFFHFQIAVLSMRFWQSMRAPNFSLVDETIYSTLAYSRALYMLNWIKDYEYEAFFMHYINYADRLPKPNEIFYFNCDFNTIKRRIKRRARKHELYFTDEYIEALCIAFSEVAGELSETHTVRTINTTKLSTEEIVSKYGPKDTD